MLDLAVLGLLKEKPMYGYELRKELDERLGRRFSFGSLYPTLKTLTKQGAVVVEERSDTASRRKKVKVYRLTTDGEALFERLVDEAGPQAAEDRETFMLRLAFFRYTRPETRRRLLERRRGYLLDHLERVKGSLKNLKERVDAYSLELMRYGELETEHEIRWLDGQLAAEREAEEAVQRRKADRTQRRARRRARVKTTTAIEPTRPAVEGS